jgi:hypothetical protein
VVGASNIILAGTPGTVSLGNNARNRILGSTAPGIERLMNNTNTIQGGGQIGADSMSLTNGPLGTILANAAAALTINTAAGGDFTNQGTLRALAGSSLNITDGYTQTSGVTDVDGTLSSGPIAIHGGQVTGDGTIAANVTFTGGSLAPGASPGQLDIQGNLNLSGANYLVELSDAGHDRVDVTGTATLGGALQVSVDLPEASPGQMFQILSAGSITGTFSNEILPPISGGLVLDVVYSPTSVTLVVEGLLGDYNGDGTVDAADYVVWRKTDGTAAGYSAWRTNFGAMAASGSVASENAAVPESTTIGMLIVGMLAMCYRRPATVP